MIQEIIVPHNFHLNHEFESTLILCHGKCNQYDYDPDIPPDPQTIVQQFLVRRDIRCQTLHVEEVKRNGKVYYEVVTMETTVWFEGECSKCGHKERVQAPIRIIEKFRRY